MFALNKYSKTSKALLLGFVIAFAASLMLVWFCESAPALQGVSIRPGDSYNKNRGTLKASVRESFKSPEDAVKELVVALKANNREKLLAIFGPGGEQLISSGDEVADRAARERFLKAYQEKNLIAKVSSRKAILEIGNDSWPFPIPLERVGSNWRFSTTEGKMELLNRRIGRNELGAIQVCLAYVDAQREYATEDRNGNGVLEYAQKFLSDPGTRDGLYWETKAGGKQSPLGPLVGQAKREGYRKKSANRPTPYHGYFYRILKSQGKYAPRGAFNYVINGKMIGGFAMVAYPAAYGSSGIKTFIVSQDGVVYEKNLGKNTQLVAQAMTRFDPNRSWHRVDNKYVELSAK